MTMRKGVAIPYIIAVLLGIAVIGIIGYWFFFLGGSLGGEISAQDCSRKLVTYCSVWLATGYGGTPTVGKWDTYAKGCTQLGIAEPDGETDCNRVLGRGGGGGKALGSICGNTDECEKGLECRLPAGATTRDKKCLFSS